MIEDQVFINFAKILVYHGSTFFNFGSVSRARSIRSPECSQSDIVEPVIGQQNRFQMLSQRRNFHTTHDIVGKRED